MIEKPRALPPVLLGIFAVSALLTVVFCLKTVVFLSVCFSFFSWSTCLESSFFSSLATYSGRYFLVTASSVMNLETVLLPKSSSSAPLCAFFLNIYVFLAFGMVGFYSSSTCSCLESELLLLMLYDYRSFAYYLFDFCCIYSRLLYLGFLDAKKSLMFWISISSSS